MSASMSSSSTATTDLDALRRNAQSAMKKLTRRKWRTNASHHEIQMTTKNLIARSKNKNNQMKTKHTNKSQSLRILSYLKSGKSLTALGALNQFSCFRLAARVHELKSMGYRINRSTIHRKGKSFCSYALAK